MKQRRRTRTKPREAKSFLMGSALAVTGFFEFLENVEAGVPALQAADRAYVRTRIRAKAIRKASKEAAVEIAKDEGEDG